MREYEWPYVDWNKLVMFRIGKVKELMKKEGLDALILTAFDNIRYATDFWLISWVEGFYEGYAAIVTHEGEGYIFSSFEETGKTTKSPIEDKPHIKELIGIPSWYPRGSIAAPLAQAFGKKLKELGATKVGIDDVPFETGEILKKQIPRIELKPVWLQLLEARAIKHAEEIKLLTYNHSILDAVAKEGLDAIREGKKTERQVAGLIVKKMYESGIECFSHGAPYSGRPFDFLATYSTGKYLQEGDSVWFDIGFYGKGGYATDIARTGFVGKAPKKLIDIYKTFHEIYFESLTAIKPGVKASEIDSIFRNRVNELGYATYPHCSGHGIGLRICEFPMIERAEYAVKDMELAGGMVICIEPFVDTPLGSLKIEDALLVTDIGYKLLTKTDYGV